jgi:pimeloyl-ACP methyl ester carboxylesterase
MTDGTPLHFVDLQPPRHPPVNRLPLVLLHKVGGWAADWRHVAAILCAERRVIVVDLPGHGGSTMSVPPPFAQSPIDSARLVLETLDALGVGRRHLVGTSLGGIVAAMATLESPASTNATASLSLLGLRDHLSRIDVPTLVLGGTRGMYVRYEATAREHIRGVRVQSIPDSGAFVHQERPAETAAALAAFIHDVEGQQSTRPRRNYPAGIPVSGEAR